MAKQLQAPELRTPIQNSQAADVRLYLVSRALKPDVKKTEKVLQKYAFHLNRIDIDESIQEMLLQTIKGLERTLDESYEEIAEYKAIDEDSQKIYTYQMENREMAFADILNNQIDRGVDAPTVNDLGQFLRDADLWAYCVEVQGGLTGRYLTFTKLNRGKVAVDERTNPESGFTKRVLRTRFNTTTAKLELLEGDTINFDKRVDCIYLFAEDKFYIFHKKHFEDIVGIEEEFKSVAQNVMRRVLRAGIIEGLENVREILANDASVHKKLYQVHSVLKSQTLDAKRIKKMQAVAKSYGLRLKVEDDKIQIKDRDDLITVIRLLDDYFLKSPQTGLKYGAPVKKRWLTQPPRRP